MRKNRKYKSPQSSSPSIGIPIVTVAFIGWVLFISSAYQPSWTFDWQETRPDIRDTVRQIEKYGRITSGVVGINAVKPQQWDRRRWLFKNASAEELTTLLDYPNSAVKATAYEGLLKRRDTDKYTLINQALNDTTTFISFHSGCIGFPMMIGEYLVDNVLRISDRNPPPTTEQMSRYKLTEEQVAYLRNLYRKRMDKKEEYFKNIDDW